MLYEQAIKEKKKIEMKMQTLETQLQALPPGKIYCSCSGKYTKWFQNDGTSQKYIPKRERYFAEQLALKKYTILQLKNLEQESRAIDFYLRHHDHDAYQRENQLIMSPEYEELLSPYFKSVSKELEEWANTPYETNNLYKENRIHKSVSGNYVRSKSEEMIDTILYRNKIPFRYECALQLGDFICYPDFTIRHPRTGDTYYWEHFGFMDDVNYSRKACSKLQQYTSYGIIPTIQLITTYETKEKPLNMGMIEEIIEKYFLNF